MDYAEEVKETHDDHSNKSKKDKKGKYQKHEEAAAPKAASDTLPTEQTVEVCFSKFDYSLDSTC